MLLFWISGDFVPGKIAIVAPYFQKDAAIISQFTGVPLNLGQGFGSSAAKHRVVLDINLISPKKLLDIHLYYLVATGSGLQDNSLPN
jgi:hypothetical protein